MKKRVSALLSGLLLCLLLVPALVSTAWAKDYDEIVNYDIIVEPNVDDGSLHFTVSFDWKALEALPHGQELKVGIPNGSVREVQALTDNIESLDNDNSYMWIYLDRAYAAGETFHFAYSWVQEYMYTLDENGGVSYDYTPGWFDEARVDHMTVTWVKPAGVDGTMSYDADQPSRWTDSVGTFTGTDLPHGAKIHLTVTYPSWPAELSWENSSNNAPDDWGGYHGGSDSYDDAGDRVVTFLFITIFILVICISIVKAARRDGYAGGFGTHYVFVNNLWYPAGPDGKPKPGSVGTAHKPKPPASHSSSGGGFGGGKHGGGFGGGGFGGGSHCACASSCACACACACAGGGRAGCSAKNLYGAIRLDEEMSRRLEERGQ